MYIVVRLSPLLAKNVPQRNRAGIKVTHAPSVANVDDAQLKVLRADQYIKICNFPSVAWFEAMGLERTEKNENKFKDEKGNPKVLTPENHKLSETARVVVLIGENGEVPQKATEMPSTDDKGGSEGADAMNGANTPPAPSGASTEGDQNKGETIQTKGLFGKAIELSASSPKEDLIKALEKKRKKAGEDFNPESTPEALFALLKTL